MRPFFWPYLLTSHVFLTIWPHLPLFLRQHWAVVCASLTFLSVTCCLPEPRERTDSTSKWKGAWKLNRNGKHILCRAECYPGLYKNSKEGKPNINYCYLPVLALPMTLESFWRHCKLQYTKVLSLSLDTGVIEPALQTRSPSCPKQWPKADVPRRTSEKDHFLRINTLVSTAFWVRGAVSSLH